ncbi:hypothetical protein F2Q68_00038870 [Brassica cretica]|uniref:Uncharacterized protein n=1 Tax=Brassica cretica TaxID=69181 RepID=A0A8S9MJH0_BRACR|nr:hypothetical protein F2Q68_00038870 [Brassica cretica]
MIKTVQRVVLNFPLDLPQNCLFMAFTPPWVLDWESDQLSVFFSGFFVFQGVEGSPGVPSIHPLDLTNKLHRKQPGTTTDQIVQPSVCLSFLSGSLSEFSIFSVMIFSTRDQKNEEEFGHNLPPNCLDEQLPKRPRLRFLMIQPDHLLHYSLFTINSHDLNQSSSVSVETYRPYVKFQERGHDTVIPDASALPTGSSTTPILIEDKERATDSMPPPPARKEMVLALRAPSIVPVAQPKGRKRKFTKGVDGESSQQGDSSIASMLRGKFMSLIDGMISECVSETSHLAGELLELQGRLSETEAMLTAVKDSHSVKVSKLEVAIGELERDLGKTTNSLLKEKKATKAKSSEVRRLQRQIEGDAGLASRGIREAKDALRSEFQARLAKISAFMGSLECIRNRDLALATIEGGMAVVQSFQSETLPTLEAEEARLSGCKGDLAVVDGDFDLILADLKSACFLPTCSEGPEGKDPVLGEGGGDAAPGLDEATAVIRLL